MILKSMSRKEPSFGQLAAYMSDDKSDRAFDLHHNLFLRDPADIAEEFDANAQHLGKRQGCQNDLSMPVSRQRGAAPRDPFGAQCHRALERGERLHLLRQWQ